MITTLGILGTVAAVLYAIYAVFQIATGIIRFVVRFVRSRRKPKPVPTRRAKAEATAAQYEELARLKTRGCVQPSWNPCSMGITETQLQDLLSQVKGRVGGWDKFDVVLGDVAVMWSRRVVSEVTYPATGWTPYVKSSTGRLRQAKKGDVGYCFAIHTDRLLWDSHHVICSDYSMALADLEKAIREVIGVQPDNKP